MKYLKSLFVLVLFITVLSSMGMASVPSIRWDFIGWHGGGCYPNLTFDPNNRNRVYLTSDVAGIYRSDDAGEHWSFMTKGLGNLTVSQVIVAPSDSNVVYAATKSGVFVYRDNAGKVWTKADTMQGKIRFERPGSYRAIAVDPKDAARVCAGTAAGALFCSTNYGVVWNAVGEGHEFFAAKKLITAVQFDAKGAVVASSASGMVSCSFDGKTCQRLTGPKNVTDFVLSAKKLGVIYAAGENRLWVSRDSGATWQQPGAATNQGKLYRLALDESGAAPLIRAAWNQDWKGGVILTRDEGKTWEYPKAVMNGDVVNGPTRAWADKNGKITGLFIDPFNANALFRTDWWGVWRSDDGGSTWNEKILGAPNTVATDIVMSDGGVLYVASMDNGLLSSRDAGKTYELFFPVKYDNSRSGHVWRVALAGNTMIGTSSPWNELVNQVIRSEDGGQTFELIRAGLPTARPKVNTMWGEGYPRALAVDPSNPDVVYLGIDGDDGGGLFISRDRGKTWQRSAGQPGSLKIYRALAVDPTNPQRIVWGACGTNGGVYISTDGGKSFIYAFKLMTWVFDVKVASDGTIFAAGDNGGAKLYVSRDRGLTWQMTGDFGAGRALAAVAVDPSDPKRLAVSTTSWNNEAPNKIFLSVDGGASWEEITGDLPDGAGASHMMIDPKSNSLYITRYAGSVYRLKF